MFPLWINISIIFKCPFHPWSTPYHEVYFARNWLRYIYQPFSASGLHGIFFYPFTFNLSVLWHLKCISSTQHTVWSCFYMQFNNLCLLAHFYLVQLFIYLGLSLQFCYLFSFVLLSLLFNCALSLLFCLLLG